MSADGVAQLVPPVDGKPFILTAMPISSLLRRLEDTISTYRLDYQSGIVKSNLLFYYNFWYVGNLPIS